MNGDILLMLDILPNYDLESQIRVVAAEFQRRFGHWPEKVLLHPSVAGKNDLTKLGMNVETPRYVPPHLMYVGGTPA